MSSDNQFHEMSTFTKKMLSFKKCIYACVRLCEYELYWVESNIHEVIKSFDRIKTTCQIIVCISLLSSALLQ